MSTSCPVVEKTDFDEETYYADFTDRLPAGVNIPDIGGVVVEFLDLETQQAPVSGGPSVLGGSIALNVAGTIVNFTLGGGTLGKVYVVRVKVALSNGRNIEGNGVLLVRIPCLPK